MSSAAAKPALQFRKVENPFSSSEKRNLIVCLLLVLLTLAVYNPVSHHPFVNFDDNLYVTQNSHVRAGLSWESVHWAFTTFDQANWHPLTWISHELDYELFKLNPAGHHYSNVLLHCANAVLLFLVLQWATGFTWRSLMVAALFALHPVNVESVAWVAERKTLLSMFFFLLALAAYGRYARKPGAGRYMLVAAMFALALMAKPMVITLPCVLLLWDYWPLGRMTGSEQQGSGLKKRSFAWLTGEKLPLFALAAASAVITMRAQEQGGAVRSLREFPLSERMGNALVAYGRYVLHACWPAGLAPMYPHPAGALPVWQTVLAALVLAAITALVIAARKHGYLAVGWFWFLGTLVPMIGLVQVGEQAMADRYAYLPYLGLFLMVSWGVAEWAQAHQIKSRWLTATAAVAIFPLVALTARQISYWGNNVTLWRHTLEVTSGNFVAEDNLGGALLEGGRSEDAIAHFHRAMAINPSDPMSRLNIAAYEQQHGALQQAIADDQAVLGMTSDRGLQVTAYSNLGSAYRELHEYPRSEESYHDALNLAPATAQAWVGLGLVEQRSGDLLQAVDDYSRAANYGPTDVEYLLLAQALEKAGRLDQAKAAEERAQSLSADLKQSERRAKQLLVQ